MTYSDCDDLLKEMSEIELAKLSGNSGTAVNHERIDSALMFAKSVIDAYSDSKYSNSEAAKIPQLIKKISNDLCVAYLYEISCADSMLPQTIVWRKTEALNLLKEIQKGGVRLDDKSVCNKTIFSNISKNKCLII